jgi:hypothetical protein
MILLDVHYRRERVCNVGLEAMRLYVLNETSALSKLNSGVDPGHVLICPDGQTCEKCSSAAMDDVLSISNLSHSA